MNRQIIFFVLVVFVFGCSVTTYYSDKAFNEQYANLQKIWLSNPTTSWEYWRDAERINSDEYFDISEDKMASTIEKLQSHDFVEIPDSEAKEFVGYYYKNRSGKKVYLVRALQGHKGTGGYTIMRKANELYISHGSLGTTSVVSKSAILIFLSEPPIKIYGDVSIAE